MQKIILLLLTLFGQGICYSQKKAIVDITLENTDMMRLEKTAVSWKEEGLLGVDERLSPNNAQNYKLSKIGNQRYILECTLNKPERYFLNLKQIFISPGDDIKLTYIAFPKRYEGTRNSQIIAIGKNNANYTYADLVNDKTPLDKHYPQFNSLRYKSNARLFFKKLTSYYSATNNYLDSLLTARGCSRYLVDFVIREHDFSYFFNIFDIEDKLIGNKSNELTNFSRLIDSAFFCYKFVAADTGNTVTMQKVFQAYTNRLINVKYKHMNTKEDFDALIVYLKKYPNPFVKGYLVYYLATDYNSLWKKYYSTELSKLTESIENASIVRAIEKT